MGRLRTLLLIGLMTALCATSVQATNILPYRHFGRFPHFARPARGFAFHYSRYAWPRRYGFSRYHFYRPRYSYFAYRPRIYSYYNYGYRYRPFSFHWGHSYGRPYSWSVGWPRYTVRSYVAPFCATDTPTYWNDNSEPMIPSPSAPTSHFVSRTPNWSLLDAGGIRYDSDLPADLAAESDDGGALETFVATRRSVDDQLEMGDQLFRNGLYSAALAQYRKVVAEDSTSAKGHVRQGYALIASGHFAQAAEAMREGLKVDPSYLRSTFRSADLYGGDASKSTEHIEALAAAALTDSSDRNPLFLIGVLLQFEGQVDRAKLFFARAMDPEPERALVLVE